MGQFSCIHVHNSFVTHSNTHTHTHRYSEKKPFSFLNKWHAQGLSHLNFGTVKTPRELCAMRLSFWC